MTIFILSNQSGIVKATASLDEATIWKATKGTFQEVLFSEGTELFAHYESGCVEINDDEMQPIATAEKNHDGVLCIDGIPVNRMNLTNDLKADIEFEEREIPEPNDCNEDFEFDSMRDYERLHKYS